MSRIVTALDTNALSGITSTDPLDTPQQTKCQNRTTATTTSHQQQLADDTSMDLQGKHSPNVPTGKKP